jgi:competence protein ComEA
MTYSASASSAGHSTRQSFSFVNAFALAVILAFSPVLTSSSLYAQASGEEGAVLQVNINKADAETIANGLNGVGLSRAREIVRYRETYGPFASLDELQDVKGIGKSTLEKNRAVLTLE